MVCVWGVCVSESNFHQSCRSLEASTIPWAAAALLRNRAVKSKKRLAVSLSTKTLCCIAVISFIRYQFRAVVIVTVHYSDDYSLVFATVRWWENKLKYGNCGFVAQERGHFELYYLGSAYSQRDLLRSDGVPLCIQVYVSDQISAIWYDCSTTHY